jgi:ABC-2 type transport system permease protein
MNYLRLFLTFFRVCLKNELAYRTNFIMQSLESIFNLMTSFVWLSVLFTHTKTLAGWRPMELVAVIGIYTLFRGALNLTIKPSFEKFMDDVHLGTLDFTLTKPEESQFLISIQQIRMWSLTEITLGVVTLGTAMVNLRVELGAWQICIFLITLLSGFAIIYSFLLMLVTCSFWLVRLENLMAIFESMYHTGRWPVGIYPRYLRFALTFLVPIAFAVTVPAEGLTNRISMNSLATTILLACGLLIASRCFWKYGLRQYSGASA